MSTILIQTVPVDHSARWAGWDMVGLRTCSHGPIMHRQSLNACMIRPVHSIVSCLTSVFGDTKTENPEPADTHTTAPRLPHSPPNRNWFQNHHRKFLRLLLPLHRRDFLSVHQGAASDTRGRRTILPPSPHSTPLEPKLTPRRVCPPLGLGRGRRWRRPRRPLLRGFRLRYRQPRQGHLLPCPLPERKPPHCRLDSFRSLGA